MKLQTITENLRQRLGIATLNAMQQRMAGDAAGTPATILLAPTGSGKTVAFAIPMLMSLGKPGRGVRAVVIAPSRELVMQTAEVVRALATGYKTAAFYGGHPMADEVNSMSQPPDIIVATPGRLADHLRRGSVSLTEVTALVVDEYDKQLELGFEKEMRAIVRTMKSLTRLILTSATPLGQLPEWMPLAAHALKVDFTAEGAEAPRGRVETVEVESPVPDKLDTLTDLLCALPPGEKTIVFLNHRDAAARVHARLTGEGLAAGLYHGALDQPQRENSLEMFENGTTPVLVSTDLGARGLDIEGVDSVVHYHLPATAESWTHRNGRTGRQGAPGTVYAIVSEADTFGDFIGAFDRTWRPRAATEAGRRAHRPVTATLYLNLGKKDKVSRGDVAGFLIAQGGLEAPQVGRISVRDRCALAAVPSARAREVVKALEGRKIKGKRVKVSVLSTPT